MSLTHQQLVQHLASSFDAVDSLIFEEQGLGSKYRNRGSIPIADVLVIKKSYSKKNVRIYEVKATQSDFNSDVNSGKYEKYLPYCDRFYFALQGGIKWKDKLTDLRCGVLTLGENGWSVRRAPKKLDRKPWSEEVYLSLLYGKYKDNFATERMRRLSAIREACLKKEVRALCYQANTRLAKKSRELCDRESKLNHLEKNTRAAVISELIQKVDGKHTRYHSGMNSLLEALFYTPLQKAFKDSITKYEELIQGGEECRGKMSREP